MSGEISAFPTDVPKGGLTLRVANRRMENRVQSSVAMTPERNDFFPSCPGLSRNHRLVLSCMIRLCPLHWFRIRKDKACFAPLTLGGVEEMNGNTACWFISCSTPLPQLKCQGVSRKVRVYQTLWRHCRKSPHAWSNTSWEGQKYNISSHLCLVSSENMHPYGSPMLIKSKCGYDSTWSTTDKSVAMTFLNALVVPEWKRFEGVEWQRTTLNTTGTKGWNYHRFKYSPYCPNFSFILNFEVILLLVLFIQPNVRETKMLLDCTLI